MDNLIKILEKKPLDINLDIGKSQSVWIKDVIYPEHEARLRKVSDDNISYDGVRIIGISDVTSLYILEDHYRSTDIKFYNFSTSIDHCNIISNMIYDQVANESTEYIKKHKEFFDPITVRLFRELRKLRECSVSPNNEGDLTDRIHRLIIQPDKPCDYLKEYKILSIPSNFGEYILYTKLALVDESEVRAEFNIHLVNRLPVPMSDFVSCGWEIDSDIGGLLYDPEVVCCKLSEFDIKKILRPGLEKFLINLPNIDPYTSDECLEIISKGIL